MNASKTTSRWLPVSVLFTAALCILTALGMPGYGADAVSKGGAQASQAAMASDWAALHMSDLSLADFAQWGASPMIDYRLGQVPGNIVHVTTRLQTCTEPVAYTSRTVGVSSPDTQPYVLTAGVPGEKVVTYSLTLHNGVEVEREKVGEEVTLQPVQEVVCLGAGGELTVGGKTYNYSQVIDMRATAYTTENRSWKRTASGTVARVGAVAVDTDVIPLGSKLYITSADGSWSYGIAVAEDTGVRGNTVDIFLDTYRECIYFGVRDARVYVLTE